MKTLVVALTLLAAAGARAQETVEVEWAWSPSVPPAAEYSVELVAAVGDTIWSYPDQTPITIGPSFTVVEWVSVPGFHCYAQVDAVGIQIRVRGWTPDRSRAGPYSVPSDPWDGPGPGPGQPGQPQINVIGYVILGLVTLLVILFLVTRRENS